MILAAVAAGDNYSDSVGQTLTVMFKWLESFA